MKKILGLLLYAGLMFGVTAGLGMFMLKKASSHGAGAAGTDDETADSLHDTHSREHSGEAQTSIHENSSSDHPGEAPPTGDEFPPANAHRTDEHLPVAVRATPMSVEEIVRMGLSLKSRDEIIRKREEALRETESQQRLVLSDVSTAQQEIESLLAQAHDQRAASEELQSRLTKQQEAIATERQSLVAEKQQIQTELDALVVTKRETEAGRTQLAIDQQQLLTDRKRLSLERDQLIADQEQLNRARLDPSVPLPETTGRVAAQPAPVIDEASQKQNLKKITVMVEGMSPEAAANTIKVLAANNQTDLIVDVLTSLEQRKASAILDAISDEKLVSEFLLRINSRNNSAKSATRN